MGWLIAAIGVLVVEALLYVEWGAAGPALLLAVIAAYYVGRFLVAYLEHTETEPGTVRGLGAAMSKVNWRSFGLIIGATALVAGANFHLASSGFEQLISVVKPQAGGSISEARGIGFADLTSYQFFLIPMVLGFYVAWKRRAQSSIFFSSWFLILFVLALVAKRVLLYASPAACLLSGVGLASLWDWAKRRSFHSWARRGPVHMWKKVTLTVLLCVTVALAFSSAYSLASTVGMSPDREWQGALAYLREETPKDSVVMSQWTWGYWILDLGQRKPLVDNGYYGWDSERLREVGLAYSTADPAEAAQAMKKWGADYLVFSKLDLNVAKSIIAWANVGKGLLISRGIL
jgi:asparagine N-glycosylation enzyme membrane subunit Stt3